MNSKENPKVLNDFLKYLRIKNYSLGTIEGYYLDLILFFNFLNEYLELNINIRQFNVFILASVKESDIIAFLVHVNYERENTGITRQRKLTSIRTFFKWLFNNYPSLSNKINPAIAINNIQTVLKIPKYLTLDEAKQIKHIFNSNNSIYPIRNNMIINLFLNTGMRLSELRYTNVNDINFCEKCIQIIGKGNKERKIFLNETILYQLKEYLKSENIENYNIDRPLFMSRQGNRLAKTTVQAICQNAFKLLGIEEKKFSTHTLRHTFATIMYKATNGDILLLKELMRHDSIESTQIYTHIDNQQLKNAYESNPLGNFGLEEAG